DVVRPGMVLSINDSGANMTCISDVVADEYLNTIARKYGPEAADRFVRWKNAPMTTSMGSGESPGQLKLTGNYKGDDIGEVWAAITPGLPVGVLLGRDLQSAHSIRLVDAAGMEIRKFAPSYFKTIEPGSSDEDVTSCLFIKPKRQQYFNVQHDDIRLFVKSEYISLLRQAYVEEIDQAENGELMVLASLHPTEVLQDAGQIKINQPLISHEQRKACYGDEKTPDGVEKKTVNLIKDLKY
ncbi:MAG: hypothetical protein GY739_16880, partial [Mesoflavibacter sp.]|nr:hypothetical protein [Mesoflavibacter sp.]